MRLPILQPVPRTIDFDDQRCGVGLSQIAIIERFAVRLKVVEVGCPVGFPNRLSGFFVQCDQVLNVNAVHRKYQHILEQYR